MTISCGSSEIRYVLLRALNEFRDLSDTSNIRRLDRVYVSWVHAHDLAV